MSRAVLWQLVLFAAVGLGCGVFILQTVLGSQALAPPMRVQVRMPDAAGIAESSQVTYRGMSVGTVSDVAIGPDGRGVRLVLNVDAGQRIPASTRAEVSMDSPMAIKHLDLRPADDRPPYLRDGSVIGPQQTGRPLPLEKLLVDVDRTTRGINPDDVSAVSRALATGLNGAGPEARRIVDNTVQLNKLLREHEPQVTNLLEQGPDAVQALSGPQTDLPQLAASMRRLAERTHQQQPELEHLLGTAPGVTARTNDLIARNEQQTEQLLDGALDAARTLNGRVPALKEALTAVPKSTRSMASIVHGDIADFYLVAAQGPVCYYDTERRTPQETAPREPRLDQNCPAGDGRAQRGADSAPVPPVPVPESSGHAESSSSDGPPTPPGADRSEPATGGGAGAPRSSISGPRPWYSTLLQGVR